MLLQDAWKDFAKAEDKETVDRANKLKGNICKKYSRLDLFGSTMNLTINGEE